MNGIKNVVVSENMDFLAKVIGKKDKMRPVMNFFAKYAVAFVQTITFLAALKASGETQSSDLLTWNCGYPFSEGVARIYGRLGGIEIARNKARSEIEGYYFFIDKSGSVVSSVYEMAGDFHEGCAVVAKRNKRGDLKYGFIDHRGNFVISARFDGARNFSEGLAAVKIGDNWGYIDRRGRVVLKFNYHKAGSFKGGVAPVLLSPQEVCYDYIGASGKIVLAKAAKEDWDFSEGVIPSTRFDGKRTFHTLKDASGNEVDLEQGAAISSSHEGLVLISGGHDEKTGRSLIGFADKSGKMAIDCKYESAFQFSEGVAAVRLNNKWGFIDRFGGVRIPFRFGVVDGEFIGGRPVFSEGLAAVSGGYINHDGVFIIKFK